ncbi:MAG: hypothetical protein AAGD03_10205, partial [Bordetella sp.]|nr:hypothetical protein [Pseudomonadota bacterium]
AGRIALLEPLAAARRIAECMDQVLAGKGHDVDGQDAGGVDGVMGGRALVNAHEQRGRIGGPCTSDMLDCSSVMPGSRPPRSMPMLRLMCAAMPS